MGLLWRRQRTWTRQQDETPHCSFCRKSQNVVGHLVSSPSNYPRARICDECIAICNQTIGNKEDYLISNPLVTEFLTLADDWIARYRDHDSEELSRMCTILRKILADLQSSESLDSE